MTEVSKAEDQPESPRPLDSMVLLIDDIDIDYEVWEDRQRGLRERFAQRQGTGAVSAIL